MSKGFFFLLIVAAVMVCAASGMIVKSVSTMSKGYLAQIEEQS